MSASARAFSSAKSPRTRLHLSPRQPWTVIASPFPGHGTPKGSPEYRRLAEAVPLFVVCECRSPSSFFFVPPPSPATQQKNGTTSKTFDPMYCCCLSPQLRSDMYTATRRFALFPSHNFMASVAPLAVLGRPELVHLGDSLLELDVLAFLVAVALVLESKGVSSAIAPRARPPLWTTQLTTYFALPRQKVGIRATPVERDQQVGAAVAVGHGELRSAHLLAGRRCCEKVSKAGRNRGKWYLVRRGVSGSEPSAMVNAIGATCFDNGRGGVGWCLDVGIASLVTSWGVERGLASCERARGLSNQTGSAKGRPTFDDCQKCPGLPVHKLNTTLS